jgi:hypothetical protein
LNMTSHMRESAVNFLGKEDALSIDDDLTTLVQCTTKESQIAFLREMREKHECLRSLKKRDYRKLFQLSGRAYATVLKKDFPQNIRYRFHTKDDVKMSMVAFITKPGINLKKSNKILAAEYRRDSDTSEVSMRKFANLLGKYRQKAKEVYVNNVYHASGTFLHLDA